MVDADGRVGRVTFAHMVIETDRLVVRQPIERDRTRFVELFTDASFTVFGADHDVASANERFDRMLAMANRVSYAKQPVIERSSGTIVGYTGVDAVDFDGISRLEWGWRLIEEARGHGFATEAVSALLSVADESDDGEVLCLIDPDNVASRHVADKVGFRWSQRVDWAGDPADPTDVLVRSIGAGGPALLPPPSKS